jgi:hypothetical protein
VQLESAQSFSTWRGRGRSNVLQVFAAVIAPSLRIAENQHGASRIRTGALDALTVAAA